MITNVINLSISFPGKKYLQKPFYIDKTKSKTIFFSYLFRNLKARYFEKYCSCDKAFLFSALLDTP